MLEKLALIGVSESDESTLIISLHRLTQVAFLLQKSLDTSKRQELFKASSILVNNAFPKQIQGRGMHEVWEKCQEYRRHATGLSDLFEKMKRAELELQCTPDFAELMKNCTWCVCVDSFSL